MRSAPSLRRARLGLGLAGAALLAACLCSAEPVRADTERDKQIKDLEQQLADLNKKLADLKAPPKPAAKKPLTVKDLTTWRTILRAALSRDGTWFAYSLARPEGKSELVVRQTRGDKEHRVTGLVFNQTFSHDGKWLAFTSMTTPSLLSPVGGPKVSLLRLDTGKRTDFDGASRFAFAGETSVLAVQRSAAPAMPTMPGPGGRSPIGGSATPAPAGRGGDLVLHDPNGGKELVLGNVAEFGFDKKGGLLALVIDSASGSGNGVQLRDMKTGTLSVLDTTAKATYQSLVWTEKGDAFTVMVGKDDPSRRQKRYSVMAFTELGGATPAQVTFDPDKDASFPKGMAISTARTPTLSEDRGTLYFGIHTPPKAAAGGLNLAALLGASKGDATKGKGALSKPGDKPDLVIWHGKDSRLQSEQQVKAGSDSMHTYLCAYRIADKKFHRLADDTVRTVSVGTKGRFAVGIDEREHELEASLHGKALRDVYAIDTHTGKRQLALKGARFVMGTSPDGNHLLYFDDGHYHIFDLAKMARRNITQSVPTSFIDVEDDHPVDRPPIFPRGWLKDGSAVILSDGWDLWKVPLGEGSAINLTGNGKRDGIRYRSVNQFDPEARGLDLSQPVYVSIYGEWTKKSGYARLEPGKPLATLCFEDAAFGQAAFGHFIKARDAEVYALTRETISEYPDYYLTGPDLKERKRLTTANPEQEKFAWCAGSKLIDYKSTKGERLQAALFLPADYKPGKKYPTVVYIYEKLSDGKNRYMMPFAMGFNPAFYTSNGYAVLMPDIKYRVNDPGVSSVECVLPALDAAIADGVVDKDKVGLQGHSWGGYQTAFLITQTDKFKAAVAGAPLTNLVSMYSSIYWNAGIGNMRIFESSQGRFSGPYWELMDAYVRNSPVFHAKKVNTPLILLHNDKDGAVDFNQGVEYYNTLRRLKKPVVMLQYKGENHGLARPANRRDYTVRMKEFFDHHLMGKPMPAWLKDGVPHLKMGEHLDERSKE